MARCHLVGPTEAEPMRRVRVTEGVRNVGEFLRDLLGFWEDELSRLVIRHLMYHASGRMVRRAVAQREICSSDKLTSSVPGMKQPRQG